MSLPIKIFSKLFKNNIKNIDIYQSFYFEIPKIILKNKNIIKYNFIHDLIPITNPEVCGGDIEKCKNNFYEQINNFIYNTKIFVITNYVVNDIYKYFPNVDKNNIIVNYLGIDKEKYFKIEQLDDNIKNQTLIKYNIPLNKKYFLSLSSLNKRKNLSFLVDCFVEFLEKNPQIDDLNLVLSGPSGWLMDEMFESISNAKKYKDRIILTGFVKDEDINIIYNSAFAFVFPSLLEGFGLPPLEAMSCGTPVLCSNKTSLPEVCGDACLSFDPRNKEELIRDMYEIYHNEGLRKELIQKGFEQSKKFDWKKTIDTIVNYYNSNS